ncbi:MAG: ABC transporter [Myxococcales bacterium]|nr:ABC transporter [Myxococcales bacterium]
MTIVLAIMRRELASAFDQPFAYFLVPIYGLLVGGFSLWFDDVFSAGTATMRGVFFWAGFFLLILVPALTMRVFAEERRSGTLEILATLPISESELVLGKFLAAWGLVGVLVASTLGYPLMLAWLSTPATIAGSGDAPVFVRMFSECGLDWGPVFGGYLGLLLLGAALTAIGLASSASTSNPIIAFLTTLALTTFPFVLGLFLDRVPPALLPLFQYGSFGYHFDSLARGVIDARDLVFWGGLTGLGLHCAVWLLEKRRLG